MHNNHEVLVKNASDKKQVKEGARKEKSKRDIELQDIRDTLKHPSGRRFIWRILGKCGPFKSALHHSGSMTYYNVGQQDLGHFIMSEITEADASGFINMMKENFDKGEF